MAPKPQTAPAKHSIQPTAKQAAGFQLPSIAETDGVHGAPVFARHETFAPRFGWLRKGYVAAAADPEIFLRSDAHIQIGVGKNMARAIRYWCHSFKLLEEVPQAGRRSHSSVPTQFGRQLLDAGGWDPYLEDPASLWLLHWRLIQDPCSATAWRFAFTMYPRSEFTIEALVEALAEFARRDYPTARAATSSLQKDVACITRMYGEVESGVAITDETIQSPFAELGLIRHTGAKRSYRFESGPKPGLVAAVVVAACLEYAGRAAMGSSTISVSRLLHDIGSPGMAFKLTESALTTSIEEISGQHRGLTLADVAGVVQLSFRENPWLIANRLLDESYGTRSGKLWYD